jgi:hypothetical protein
MLLASGLGVFASVMVLGITFLAEHVNKVPALVGLVGFMAAFSFGCASLPLDDLLF